MPVKKACEFLSGRKNVHKKKMMYTLEVLKKNSIHYDKTQTIFDQLKMQIEIDK